jgi:hypothetical protein
VGVDPPVQEDLEDVLAGDDYREIDLVPVPAPDESLRPSVPGQWGSPEDWDQGDDSLTSKPVPDIDKLLDSIEYDDLFTDNGVVVSALYMDWYIERVLAEKNPDLKFHSDPGAYIVDNDYYSALIDLGAAGIPRVEKALLEPDSGGVSVYLLALVLENNSQINMSGILDQQFPWATAGEFLDKWLAIKASATKDVRTIANSEKYTTSEKLKKISDYGLLAVPALAELKDSSALSSGLKKELRTQLDSLGASGAKDIASIAEWLDM